MSDAPEFVEIDEASFFIGPVLGAAGIPAEFFEGDNLDTIMETGEAFEYGDDPNTLILQYPSHEGGVSILLELDGDAYGLINAWPFLPQVLNAEVEPLKVAASPDGRQAFVTGRVGNAAVVFFDDGYIENAPAYRTGEIFYAQFYGILTQASLAEEEEFQVSPGDEGYQELLESGRVPDENGVMTISWDDAAGMMPRFDIAPNAFEFRGPVTAIDPLTDWLVPDTAIVHVTIMRPFSDEDGNPVDEGFDLPMLIRPEMIEGGALPQPGDEIQGLAFLYGTGFSDDEEDEDEDGAGDQNDGVPLLS